MERLEGSIKALSHPPLTFQPSAPPPLLSSTRSGNFHSELGVGAKLSVHGAGSSTLKPRQIIPGQGFRQVWDLDTQSSLPGARAVGPLTTNTLQVHEPLLARAMSESQAPNLGKTPGDVRSLRLADRKEEREQPRGKWDLEQTHALGTGFANGTACPQLATYVEMLEHGAHHYSVLEAVQSLNAGTLTCESGLGVVYSASHRAFYLLHRSDQKAAAFNAMGIEEALYHSPSDELSRSPSPTPQARQELNHLLSNSESMPDKSKAIKCFFSKAAAHVSRYEGFTLKDMIVAAFANGIFSGSLKIKKDAILRMCPVFGSERTNHVYMVMNFCCALAYSYMAVVAPEWFELGLKARGFPRWWTKCYFALVAYWMIQSSLAVRAARIVLNQSTPEHMIQTLHREQLVTELLESLPRQFFGEQVVTASSIVVITLLVYMAFPAHGLDAIKYVIAPGILLQLQVPFVKLTFHFLCKITDDNVEVMIQKLERTTNADRNNPLYWRELTLYHQCMDKCIETLWTGQRGGRVLFNMLAHRAVLLFVLIVAAFDTRDILSRVFCSLFAFICVWKVIFLFLLPLARITSRCNSVTSGKRSIKKLANAFFGHPGMGPEASREHSLFVQYLQSEPTGVELPVLGMVSARQLVYHARILFWIASGLIGCLLRALHADEMDSYPGSHNMSRPSC